jgi:hypothetical protein
MIACTCTRAHDGSPCLCACHLRYEGRDGAAILNTDEVSSLALLAARKSDTRRWMDGRAPRPVMDFADDMAPMVYRTEDAMGRLTTQTAPWRLAIDVD